MRVLTEQSRECTNNQLMYCYRVLTSEKCLTYLSSDEVDESAFGSLIIEHLRFHHHLPLKQMDMVVREMHCLVPDLYLQCP